MVLEDAVAMESGVCGDPKIKKKKNHHETTDDCVAREREGL